MDLLAAILAAKEQGIGQSCLVMAYLRADIMAVRFLLKNSNRRNDVRHYRLVHS